MVTREDLDLVFSLLELHEDFHMQVILADLNTLDRSQDIRQIDEIFDRIQTNLKNYCVDRIKKIMSVKENEMNQQYNDASVVAQGGT